MTPSTFTVGSFPAQGEVDFVEVPLPEPGPGEALVRIEAAAICTMEQRVYSGAQERQFPFLGGHENAGVVESFGPGYRGPLKPGDRVAMISSSCGSCEWCHTGRDNYCKAHYSPVVYGSIKGPGGFAQYKLHGSDGLYPIGDQVSAAVASLAEPFSCALHAARLAAPRLGEDAVVIGAGVMGLLNLVALKQYGARVIVSEMEPKRLELAQRLGADEVVDASSTDAVAAIKALCDDTGPQTVVTAVGHPAVNEQALELVAPYGTIVLFASMHPDAPLDYSTNLIHKKEYRVIGSNSSEKQDCATAARLLRKGLADLEPLIQATYPLSSLPAALEEALQPNAYRIIIEPWAAEAH